MQRNQSVRILSRAIPAWIAALALSGCEPTAKPSRPSALETTRAAEELVCTPTGAHGKHGTLGYGCADCHPCGGGFISGVVPGTSGTSGTSATCYVSCHTATIGASPTVTNPGVKWDAGTLWCGSCHYSQGVLMTSGGSAHPIDAAATEARSASCRGCHVTDTHKAGTVKVVVVGAAGAPDEVLSLPVESAELDRSCVSCHDGQGRVLAGRTPPSLDGFLAAGGDVHGAAGAAAPLSCASCHDHHSSTSGFLLPEVVNGNVIAGGTVSRSGVGAAAFCESCHTGPRHTGCTTTCHYHDGTPRQHLSDPATASTPCYFCHGHDLSDSEVNLTERWFCDHCHQGPTLVRFTAQPPTTPLTISALKVTPTSNGAVFEWNTNERASSYVEIGTGEPDRTVGSSARVYSHRIELSDLTPGVRYVAGVRSADGLRRVALASAGSVTPGALSPPVLIDMPDKCVYSYNGSAILTFYWNTYREPPDRPVVQTFELSSSPDFASATAYEGLTGNSHRLTLPRGTYYWRVKARYADSADWSDWSIPDSFSVIGCYDSDW